MDHAIVQRDDTATLYYDGNCPLCMAEMERLGRLKSDRLQLADIHDVQPGDDLPQSDVLLRNLHLRLPNGKWVTGVEANVAAWGYTGRGLWFRWLRWPVIRSLADRIYNRWARWRYDRLYASPGAPRKRAQHAPD